MERMRSFGKTHGTNPTNYSEIPRDGDLESRAPGSRVVESLTLYEIMKSTRA